MENKKKSRKKSENPDGQPLLAGRKPVEDILAADPGRVELLWFRKVSRASALDGVIKAAKKAGVRHRFVPTAELDRLFSGNHQGVVARLAAVRYVDVPEAMEAAFAAPLPLLVALDKVQDTGNAGAIARTAWALGAGGLIVPRHEAASLGDAALRVSAGALASLPIARCTNLAQALDDCRAAGFRVYAAHKDVDSEDLHDADLTTPAVLVLGNEDKGVRPGVLKHCDESLAIPFSRPFDSLNVSAAAAILLAEFARRAR